MSYLNSLGNQRKGDFRDRFRGLAWDKLPAAYCLAGVSKFLLSLGQTGRGRVVLGHKLNTQILMKTDEQKKVLSKFAILCGAAFMAILGRIQPGGCWVLCLEAFISLLQVGILGEVSGKGFSRIFISFPGVSLICLCVKMRA